MNPEAASRLIHASKVSIVAALILIMTGCVTSRIEDSREGMQAAAHPFTLGMRDKPHTGQAEYMVA